MPRSTSGMAESGRGRIAGRNSNAFLGGRVKRFFPSARLDAERVPQKTPNTPTHPQVPKDRHSDIYRIISFPLSRPPNFFVDPTPSSLASELTAHGFPPTFTSEVPEPGCKCNPSPVSYPSMAALLSFSKHVDQYLEFRG